MGRRQGKGISRCPASRRLARTPTLEAHGPDRAPRQVASGVLRAGGGERRAGQKRAPGISEITNRLLFIYLLHLLPTTPTRPCPRPWRPQQLPAKTGQNQKERGFGRGRHAVAEVSL